MNNLVCGLVLMIVTWVLSNFIYIRIDKKYEVTNKICAKLHIKQEWIGISVVCCLLIYLLIVQVLGIELIDIPKIFYYIFGGVFSGICTGTNSKNEKQ